MTPQASNPPSSIRSRLFDALWFSLGWIPVLVAFVVAKEWATAEGQSVIRSDAGKAILLFILVVNFVHRHITFPLVYGDKEVFAARPRRYVVLPLLFAALTLTAIAYRTPATASAEAANVGAAGLAQDHALSLYFSADKKSAEKKAPKRTVRLQKGMTLEQVANALEKAATRRDDDENERLWRVRVEDSPAPHLTFKADAPMVEPGATWFAIRAPRAAQKELGLAKVAMARRHASKKPLMALLVALSVLWTIYHTLMQKMGILRIYARVAQAGSATLDRAFVFGWFIAMVAHLAARDDVRETAARVSSVGRMVKPAFDAIAPGLVFAQYALVLVALGITIAWLKTDLASGRLHPMRTLFAASLLVLYAAFTYDLVIGFATLAFSHSIEYIAFVSVFVARKYQKREATALPWVGRMARRPFRSVVIFAVLTTTVFAIARTANRDWLDVYIVGSSFLHFLYDGWLWKVRKPEVRDHLPTSSAVSDAPNQAPAT